MTPTKRKLLSILAAQDTEVTFPDLFRHFPGKSPFAVVLPLGDLKRSGLVQNEWRDKQSFYSITPAGRAALIPERSAP